MNAGSLVIAVTTSDGPICCEHLRLRHLARRWRRGQRNSRLASGCSKESQRTMVGRR